MTISGFIGVVCREAERPCVEEFFELFKIPWESYRPDCQYSAVISTEPNPGRLNCDLLVIYSSAAAGDAVAVIESNGGPVFIDIAGAKLPLYRNVAAFSWGVPLAQKTGSGSAVVVETTTGNGKTIRAGFDLFSEVGFLLNQGQPAEHALIPALEL